VAHDSLSQQRTGRKRYLVKRDQTDRRCTGNPRTACSPQLLSVVRTATENRLQLTNAAGKSAAYPLLCPPPQEHLSYSRYDCRAVYCHSNALKSP
jgi:hypothetical protein